ncbi:MAG: hypothetical protein LBS34_03240 [Rickettsiales bacterium]|nr:hypothetical protein [Rickettsiales bacterium]
MFEKIKNSIGVMDNTVSEVFRKIKVRTPNLKGYNMTQAVDYIELGMVDEAYNRLKIIIKLWPDDDYAKYLMGLLCIFIRDNKKALKFFGDIKDFRNDQVKRLVKVIEANRVEKIIERYRSTLNLYEIENEIQKIEI